MAIQRSADFQDALSDAPHMHHHHHHHNHRTRRVSDIGGGNGFGHSGHTHEGHYQLVNYSHYKSSSQSPYVIYISVE